MGRLQPPLCELLKADVPLFRYCKMHRLVVGSNYGTYEDIRYKHFRHHVDNDDVVWFDYEAFFKRHPFVLNITKALEWCYIPAHCLIMHLVTMLSGFLIPERRDQRRRCRTQHS